MIQAAAAKQRERQQHVRSEQGSAATAAAAHEGQRLQHVQVAAQHVRAGGHELQAAAADAPADAAAVSQRAEHAALGGKVAAGAQHQLASLEQLSQQQLANLAQAAQHAKQQLAASLPARQQASVRRLQQQQPKQAVQQQGAQPGGAQQATAAAAVRGHLSGMQSAASRAVHAVSAQVPQQVIGLQQAGQQLQARLRHKQSADRRQQQTAAPSRPPQQQQAAADQQHRAAAQPQPARNVAAARHAVAAQPAAPPPSKQAPSHAGMGRFVLAWVLGAAASALLLLRWLRTQRRKARVAQEAIRDAEQRARAAKLYDRQRQRFQRALLAAEDLEGADSSVFTAVSRKGSTNGSPGTQNAGSDAGGGAAEGAGGNPFMRGLPGGAAAAALAGADVEDEEEDSNADVFDPASWDDDVRRQWESFVSSSKVNKGKLWDTTQVDEGLPEVPVGSAQAATAAPGDPSGLQGDSHSRQIAEEVLKEGLPRDHESVANKALKEAARGLERREALTRQDHTVPKGGLAAEVQSAAAHRLHPEESEVAALVRRRVAAAMGPQAAEARAARQPLEKRPHTVEELLQAGASELEHRESGEGRRHERHGLAARAQSVADRAAHGRHPAVEDKVLERLNQPGSGFGEG
ncbi:hypothetical protein ABPG77_010193 [Micractinium sp. CCAP 211/92]